MGKIKKGRPLRGTCLKETPLSTKFANFRLWTAYLALLLCLALVWGCAQQIANLDSRGRNIICFGDSITEGAGSTEGCDYPSLLSRKLNMDVINAGAGGSTSRDGLKRIEKDVLEYNPRLVIVEFGGNDFLQGIPRQETFDNLDKMVVMIQKNGAMVTLAGVRVGYFIDEYLAGLRKIAKKRQAILIPNIMKGISFNPAYKSDDIHPNDAGYRLIADRIYKAIKPLLRK